MSEPTRAYARFVLVLLCGCGTSTVPSTNDAGADATACTIDASYTCDVSSLSQASLLCATWSGGTGDDNTVVSCPAAPGWDVGASTREPACTYTWTKGGPPDPCALPPNDASAFTWLAPSCDAGAVCP
ncbi:MAG TPA: hypothetical protein VH054_28695 [Polyangiaceae bacterium]|nr:hypothetical protein [Polyangiaceae bacterium]